MRARGLFTAWSSVGTPAAGGFSMPIGLRAKFVMFRRVIVPEHEGIPSIISSWWNSTSRIVRPVPVLRMNV